MWREANAAAALCTHHLFSLESLEQSGIGPAVEAERDDAGASLRLAWREGFYSIQLADPVSQPFDSLVQRSGDLLHPHFLQQRQAGFACHCPQPVRAAALRAEERRVGKECVSTCR